MKIRWIIFAGMWSAIAFAQTNVSGNQYGVWNLEGNPYQVVGNVIVPPGYFLTIQAGVEVRFMGYYSFLVQGGMCAWGTETDSVKFVAPSAFVTGYWKNIEYRDVLNDSTILHYCLIQGGDRAVFANGTAVDVQHCLIQRHELSPVHAVDGEITLTECLITDNNGSGLALESSSANLTNCTITYSGGTSGHGINAGAGADVTVNGGYIGNNTGTGVYGLQAGTIYLQNVEIAENGDSGVQLTLCSQLTANRVSIHDNNGQGIFVSSTPMDGRNLTISSNHDYGVIASGQSGVNIIDLTSSIVDRNGSWGVKVQSAVGFLAYNDYYDNDLGSCTGVDPGTGSLEEDPLYVNYATRDFNLQDSSPCLDTGAPFDPLDPDGTRTDMGAFFYPQNPVSPKSDASPQHQELLAVYPNPFNLAASIAFQSPSAQDATINVLNMQGRLIDQIWTGRLSPGLNVITWRPEELASGAYVIDLQGKSSSASLPCVLVK